MVSDWNQNRRRKEFSTHAPTMGNGCLAWNCHRSWPKSRQTLCDIFAFCRFLLLSASKKTRSTFLMFMFSVNSLSVRRPVFLCPRFTATKFIGAGNSFFFVVDCGFEIAVQSGEFSVLCSLQFFTPNTAPKDPTVAPTTSITAAKTAPRAPSTSLMRS